MGLCYGDGSLLAIFFNAIKRTSRFYTALMEELHSYLQCTPTASLALNISQTIRSSPSKGPAPEESACQPSQSHFPVIVLRAQAHSGGHIYSEMGLRHYRRQTTNVYLYSMQSAAKVRCTCFVSPSYSVCVCVCMCEGSVI